MVVPVHELLSPAGSACAGSRCRARDAKPPLRRRGAARWPRLHGPEPSRAFPPCRLDARCGSAALRPVSRPAGLGSALVERAVARWLCLHRMTPPRAGLAPRVTAVACWPATTRSVALAAVSAGRSCSIEGGGKPHPAAARWLCLSAGPWPRGRPAGRRARAINCTAVSLIAVAALLNMARARPAQKTPAPNAYAACQKILGGGRRPIRTGLDQRRGRDAGRGPLEPGGAGEARREPAATLISARPATPSCSRAAGLWSMPGRATATGA